MSTYPTINVYKKTNPKTIAPGFSGRIAVIGAFDTTETEPIVCEDLDEAYNKLGTDKSYDGVSCLQYLFGKTNNGNVNGAESLIAVNITKKSGSAPSETIEKNVTVDNLTSSLAKIKNEQFDMLFVVAEMTDVFIPIITSFSAKRLSNKMPIGYMFALTRNSISAYETTSSLIDDSCYGVLTQQFVMGETTLSLVNSTAYYMGLIAGTNVSYSMTKKKIDGVTGLTPELVFESLEEGISGLDLLNCGITTFECFDRRNEEFVCVNSEQPNGLDLYINRVRDYVIREMSLHKFLGDRNRPRSLTAIEQELSRIRKMCIDELDLLKDIEYNVIKNSDKCVDVNITKLLFDGVITNINVYYTIEVD